MLKALAIVPSVLNLIKQSSPNQSLQHRPLEIPMSTTATLSTVYTRDLNSAVWHDFCRNDPVDVLIMLSCTVLSGLNQVV